MNKYSFLKILSFILSALTAVLFLAILNSATQTAHIIILIIILIIPSILFALLGKWALKKEKEVNLIKDPNYYVNLKKEKELKVIAKKEKKQQLQDLKQRKIDEAELLKSQESIDDYTTLNSSKLLLIKPKEIRHLIPASKTIQIGKFTSDELIIDDENKEFYIIQGKTLHRYEFNKLSEFEYIENGNSIISGKTGSTIVGGLLLGPLGALAGASGKRKQNEIIKSSKVKMFINDLNNPLIEFDVPLNGVNKNSATYNSVIQRVDEFLSLLNYVRNTATN